MSRQQLVARQIVDVGRSLNAFNFEDGQYLSRTVDEAMKEAERAFSAAIDAEGDGAAAQAVAHYDQAEHLAKVVACLVRREAPRFAANPKMWIETRRELQT
jgi:hypothetical protein